MFQKIRNIPLACFLISLFRILNGCLKYSNEYLNKTVQMQDGSKFTIFRQITKAPIESVKNDCVFIVRFKFKHLSHKRNQIVSVFPMLFIAGHPGFVSKCYGVNYDNEYWIGIYQWRSLNVFESYKKSFVFRIMNKRAIPGTIESEIRSDLTISKFMKITGN